MNDFQLYSKLRAQSYNTNTTVVNKPDKCEHSSVILSNDGFSLCSDCGLEISKQMNYEKEWKYYGPNDTKNIQDPSRCYIRKTNERSIYKDIQHIEISQHIKDIANMIYNDACNDKIHRGTYRKGIIFASVFHAYKVNNTPQSCDKLIKIFKIHKKHASKGMNYINENASKESPIWGLSITAAHLIHEFMSKFETTKQQTAEVIALYDSIKGKSNLINRCKPQSIAAGLIYYYTYRNNKPINLKEFVKKVHLSELTVTKISKECSRIFDNQ